MARSSDDWESWCPDLAENAVHGLNQRHRDEADHHAHSNDDERFNESRDPLDLVVQFTLVIARSDLELAIQAAGFLTDPNHLRGRRREELRVGERLRDTGTFEHLLAHLGER